MICLEKNPIQKLLTRLQAVSLQAPYGRGHAGIIATESGVVTVMEVYYYDLIRRDVTGRTDQHIHLWFELDRYGFTEAGKDGLVVADRAADRHETALAIETFLASLPATLDITPEMLEGNAS